MNEHDFDSQIQDLISIGSWDISYHVFEQGRYARRTEKGFPDYFLVRGDRVMTLEIMGTDGKLTDDQVICLELLRLTRKIETYALWPEDSDLAVSILRADTHDEIEEA